MVFGFVPHHLVLLLLTSLYATLQVETELYAELKRDLGKNFKLFAETVNLKEWKKKGPYVPPEADMGSKRNAQACLPVCLCVVCSARMYSRSVLTPATRKKS